MKIHNAKTALKEAVSDSFREDRGEPNTASQMQGGSLLVDASVAHVRRKEDPVAAAERLGGAVLELQRGLALEQRPLVLLLVVPKARRRRLACGDDPFHAERRCAKKLFEDLLVRLICRKLCKVAF